MLKPLNIFFLVSILADLLLLRNFWRLSILYSKSLDTSGFFLFIFDNFEIIGSFLVSETSFIIFLSLRYFYYYFFSLIPRVAKNFRVSALGSVLILSPLALNLYLWLFKSAMNFSSLLINCNARFSTYLCGVYFEMVLVENLISLMSTLSLWYSFRIFSLRISYGFL